MLGLSAQHATHENTSPQNSVLLHSLICLYRGITECYDIQLIDLHVSTTDFIYII